MRFLADENIPGDAVTELEAAGHDIVWVRTVAPGSKDEDVLALAVREERIILTWVAAAIQNLDLTIFPSRTWGSGSSNSWAEFAGIFRSTRQAFLQHERSRAELKALMPDDAKEAIGHGVRAKRSKSGAISFDLLEAEDGRAAL